MGINIEECGQMDTQMGMGCSHGLMEVSTKATSEMGRKKGKGC